MTIASNLLAPIIDESNQDHSNSHEPLQPSPSASNKHSNVIIYEKGQYKDQQSYTMCTHGYRLGKFLGRGASAKVYQCTALDTGKQYAIKIIPNQHLSKCLSLRSLRREICIHASMKHKHICKFKHYFQDESNVYILLELCPNGTLHDLIFSQKHLTERQAAFVLMNLLDGVEYMHSKLVIHGDLKPSNIFIDRKMQIKVGDFGLSHQLKHASQKSNRWVGTPNYVAPEVLQSKMSRRNYHHVGYSMEVDVWSMGVILYTMLVGRPPFQRETVKETFQQILAHDYEFPSHVNLSAQARHLISIMLHPNPNKRATLYKIRQHWLFHVLDYKIPSQVTSKASPVLLERVVTSRTKKCLQQDTVEDSQETSNEEQQQLTIPTTTTLFKSMMDPFELMAKKFRWCLHQEGFAILIELLACLFSMRKGE